MIDIDQYQPNPSDSFLFDNNIWMYLYCPLGNYGQHIIKKYDRFLKKTISSGSRIYITSLTLSEFINAYSRLEFNLKKRLDSSTYQDYKKDFKGTQEYKDLIDDIVNNIKGHILKVSSRISDSFETIDSEVLLNDLNESDFNDKYYAVLSYLRNMILVTDDADFINE
ncbi:MAG: hypothetical protein GWN16_14715, partial [Calditrichae bacterium]|nr:hypothetical protein [Calditrichia bacterium]